MANTQAKSQTARHLWVRAWPVVTLTFAALVFGALATQLDPLQAQETPKSGKAAAAKKGVYAPNSKNLPVAKSLTNGSKIDSLALAKLIDQEINKRIQADKATSTGRCD